MPIAEHLAEKVASMLGVAVHFDEEFPSWRRVERFGASVEPGDDRVEYRPTRSFVGHTSMLKRISDDVARGQLLTLLSEVDLELRFASSACAGSNFRFPLKPSPIGLVPGGDCEVNNCIDLFSKIAVFGFEKAPPFSIQFSEHFREVPDPEGVMTRDAFDRHGQDRNLSAGSPPCGP